RRRSCGGCRNRRTDHNRTLELGTVGRNATGGGGADSQDRAANAAIESNRAGRVAAGSTGDVGGDGGRTGCGITVVVGAPEWRSGVSSPPRHLSIPAPST